MRLHSGGVRSAVLGLVCLVPVNTTGLSQKAAQRSTEQLVTEALRARFPPIGDPSPDDNDHQLV